MGWGDELVAAGQAQRLYDADPSSRLAICDALGHPRWHALWDGNPIIARPVDVANGERVRIVTNGPGCRPYIVYPFSRETGWTFNRNFRCCDHVARIYLTEAERQRGELVKARNGPYVLIEPYTKHENFTWPIKKWQQLIEACSDVVFVQHTHPQSPVLRGVHLEAATFREACGLMASAEVYVRSESGLCHAAAALGTRQVTLFGGCMDPEVMAGYPGQTVLADRGHGSPCGSWLPCKHCAEAMKRIKVDDVAQAISAHLRAEVAA